MGNDVRRSGRATKGQHPKNQEAPEAPTPKQRGKGNKSKAKQASASPPPEDDADAIIRCICGYVEEDEEDDRVMIVCDNCEAWQHNECMEVSEEPNELPDQYFCELCRPEDHRELLAKVKRGEKPWEERTKQREREELERKARRRKGGKKGKKGRASEIKADDAKSNGTPSTTPASTPAKKPIPEPVAAPAAVPSPPPRSASSSLRERNVPLQSAIQQPATPVGASAVIHETRSEARVENGQKRKLPAAITTETHQTEQQEPSNKLRKISSPIETKPPPTPTQRRKSSVAASAAKRDVKGMVLQTELVQNISDLQSEPRRRIAEALVNLFVDQTQQAQTQGVFELPQGQSSDAFGLKLGLAVEYAVYLNFWGQSGQHSGLYAEKFRSISHNVKNNTALRDRLLTGALSPNEFSKMSTFDMASKELQEKTAEMKKEAEKQHMLIQEEGPRIRRTHKGEELVGDELNPAAGADQVFSQPIIRRRETDLDLGGQKHASPEASNPQSPPAAVELPENITYPAHGGPPTATPPLVVDTKALPRPSKGTDKGSAPGFDIQNVWSSVTGPDGENQRRQPSIRTETGNLPAQGPPPGPAAEVEADPEIDKLLKDEEPDDEEPYSPMDYTTDPGSFVWRGKMSMAGVAEFSGVAKHVAGANLSSTYPWSQLIPSTLNIGGRINIDRASDYLCGLRWSHTSDVCVVSITPNDDPATREQFDKLFQYFTERKRYGVINKSPIAAVKDIYLVPLEVGISEKPDFVELLEYCTIEDPSPERMLLLTFVIKSNNSPSAQVTPRQHLDATSVASPITAGAGAQPPASFLPMAHASPTPPYAGHSAPPFAGSPPHPQQQQHSFMPTHASPYPPHQAPQSSPYPLPGAAPPPTGMEAARKALGELALAPVVAQLLTEAPHTGVPEFAVIRDLLESVPAARNDFAMLKGMLTIKHQQGSGGAPLPPTTTTPTTS